MSVRHPVLSTSRAVAAAAAAALALGLAPAAAAEDTPDATPATSAEPSPEPSPETNTEVTPGSSTEVTSEAAPAPAARTTSVRLKVARQAPRSIETTKSYARGALRAEGVRMGAQDVVRVVRDGRRVRPAGARRLRSGDTVRVVRVEVRTSQRRVAIAPRTVTRTVTRLAPGARRVSQPGRPGVRLVRVTRRLHNWTQVDREVRRTVVRSPRPRRVLVGARPRSVAGADHLRWGALADCESSGNPRAVNPAGYYGLYQFNVATWRSVGGSGMPHHASAAEQTHRAKLLYRQRGRSPWPHCGRLL